MSLQADLKNGNSSTSIFRTICKAVLADKNIWANSNRVILEKDYPVILACRGME